MVVEIRQNPEHLVELAVQLFQQIVDVAGTDQNNLDVERNDLRFQRHRVDSEFGERRLDFDLAGFQSSFQTFPDERIGQYFFRVENQVAAVCPMQRTGANAPVIGDQGTLFVDVFDTAEQILIDRMRLVNDRRAAVLLAIDQNVGKVLFTQNQSSGAVVGMFLGSRRHQEIADRAAQIFLQFGQIGDDVVDVLIFFVQFGEQRFDGQADGVLVQLPDFLDHLAPPLRQFEQYVAQVLLQLLAVLMELFPFGLRQQRELVLVQRLVVADRQKGYGLAVAVQGHVHLAGFLVDQVDGAVVALREPALDRGFLLLIRRAFEGRRESGQQIIDQGLDILAETVALARGQLDHHRFPRIVEIFHISVGRRRFPAFGVVVQVVGDHRQPSRARLAHYIYVVTRGGHRDAETERGLGPRLPKNGMVAARYFGDRQRIRVEIEFQRGNGKSQIVMHRCLFCAWKACGAFFRLWFANS